MRYSARADETLNQNSEFSALWEPLEALVRGLGLALIELDVFRTKARKGSPAGASVRVIVYKAGSLGTDDCSRAHRAILPQLEQAFPGSDLSVEVSSPGINRQIKDGV
jgi:ribosome maturation factor RimP